MAVNIEKLKRYLKDYYGTAAVNVAEVAMMNVFDIDSASLDELKVLAENAGVDIMDFDDDYERW